MKKPNGQLCTTPEDNATVFQTYFQQRYEGQPTFHASVLKSLVSRKAVENLDHSPDGDEIRKAVRNLKERAPGDSGITPQVWKALVENESSLKYYKQ